MTQIGTYRVDKDNKLGEKAEDGANVVKKSWDTLWLKNLETSLMEEKVTKPYKQVAAVYAAVRSIANGVNQVPFNIYNWETDEVDWYHPFNQLFRRPNPHTTRSTLWSLTTTYMCLEGEAFWVVQTGQGSKSNTPVRIYVARPSNFSPVFNEQKEVIGWTYNKTIPFDLSEIVHFKYPNPHDDYRGLSPIESIRVEMDTDYRASKYNQAFFRNSARPDGVLEVPDELSEDAFNRMKAQWRQKYGADDNRAHSVAVLEAGTKYNQMGLTQKDMDFIESRRLSREYIFMVFGVPPNIAGVVDKNTNKATAFTSKAIFYTNTIAPLMMNYEDTLAAQFFDVYDQSVYGAFDKREIRELQGVLEDKATTAQSFFNMGIPIGSINRLLNLGFYDNEIEDEMVPVNLIERGESIYPNVSENNEDTKQIEHKEVENVEDKAAKRRVSRRFAKKQRKLEQKMFSKMKRFFYEQKTSVMSVIRDWEKSVNKQQDLRLLTEKIGEIWEDEAIKLQEYARPVTEEAVLAGSEIASDTMKISFTAEINPKLEQIVKNRMTRIDGVNTTIQKQIREKIYEGVQEGASIAGITDKISSIYSKGSQYARRIARTETVSAMNEASLTEYKDNGVQMKEWLTAGDGEVRDSHSAAEGQGPIRMDHVFVNGLAFPGDPSGDASEVVNCRCTLVPVIQ